MDEFKVQKKIDARIFSARFETVYECLDRCTVVPYTMTLGHIRGGFVPVTFSSQSKPDAEYFESLIDIIFDDVS